MFLGARRKPVKPVEMQTEIMQSFIYIVPETQETSIHHRDMA